MQLTPCLKTVAVISGQELVDLNARTPELWFHIERFDEQPLDVVRDSIYFQLEENLNFSSRSLLEWAEHNPPPQSWFDEDFTGLFAE